MSGFDLTGCHALITGASAGIGREFARQVANRARVLVLVARRRERLDALRDEVIRGRPNLQVHVRKTDLRDEAQLEALCDWMEREKIVINLLINNAGLGDVGPFATSEPARSKEILLVNMMALTLLTRRLLPPMIAQKRGAVLNVSSSAGFLPIAGFAVYAASKGYVTSFSEAIRAELRGTGVNVTTLCPGPVHTEFMSVARRGPGVRSAEGPEFAHILVEQVVRAALRGVEAGRALVTPGFVMKVGMVFVRLAPMPLLRFAARFSAK